MESFADTEGRQWYLAARAPLNVNLAALAGYLQQQGIAHRINEDQGSQAIWVAEAAAAGQVNELLDGLQSGRIQIQSEEKPQAGARHSEWKKFASHSRLALHHVPVTCVLLLLSVLGWLLIIFEPTLRTASWFTFVQQQDLFEAAAFEHLFTPSEPWRLITPMFLHFSIFHILFNSVVLWAFGGRIEMVIGSLRYLLLVISSSIVSNIGQYMWQSDINFGGMSGVNYAFVGYLWMRQILSPHPMLSMPMSIIGFMLVWLLLGVVGIIDQFMVGGIANGAHVAGLLAGVTWGVMHGINKYPKDTQSQSGSG